MDRTPGAGAFRIISFRFPKCRACLGLILGFLVALPFLAGTAAAVSAPAVDAPGVGWENIAARVVPATVNILVVKIASGAKDSDAGSATTPGDRERFVGSGFVVDPSGIIVTNKHVIAGALWITVRLEDGSELPAKVIAASRFIDLALLKVDAGHPLPTLQLGDGDAARPGEPVLAIGDPQGVGTSLSAGIVSGTQRDLMNTPFDDYVQTDAAINHGNSGGPLIDSKGHVIGVNTILLTNLPNEGSNGLGFAISSNIVADALRHLLHPERQPIGWIGLHLQGMTPNLSRAMGLPRPGGAIVTAVDADSPASALGLQPGDVVLRYGGKTPPSARLLMRAIATTPVGATRTLDVWTGGSLRQVAVTIREWPGMNEPAAELAANPRQLLPPPSDLGLLLAPIAPLARQVYKLGKVQGVLVVAVDRMSEAYSRGLRPGMVIERVQGQQVTTPAAAWRLVGEVARHLPVVALLIRWPDGPHWLALHTGYQPGTTAGHGPVAADGAVRPAIGNERAAAPVAR